MVVRIEIDLIDEDDVDYVVGLIDLILGIVKKGIISDVVEDEYP